MAFCSDGIKIDSSIVISPGGVNFYLQVYGTTNWFAAPNPVSQVQVNPAALDITKTYRFVVHAYNNSEFKIDTTITPLDAAGNPDSAAATTVTYPVPANLCFFEGMNALGIRNVPGTNSTGTPSRWQIDNMYFSTVGPQTITDTPSWLCLNKFDMNCDKAITFADFGFITDAWLSETDLFSDLNDSKRIDLGDIALWANEWMNYQ